MIEYELADGTVVKMSLQMTLLNKLKNWKPEAYRRCFKSMGNKKADPIMANPEVMYGGYLCGLIADNKLDQAMEYSEFLAALPDDLYGIMQTAKELMSPKGRRASEKHLKKIQKSEETE